MWPFLLTYGSHDMRHTGFRRLTVVNETPGVWSVTEYDVSLYILVLLPISPCVTLFASHHYHQHFHWMSLCPWVMRFLMHVAFHIQGHEVVHWVFESSFPSVLLSYHPEPILRFVS